MQNSDSLKFADLMARMGETFQTKVTPVMTDAYFEALREFPFHQVAWAMQECIKDCLFFPKPKEIRDAMFAERHEGKSEYQRTPLALPEHRDPAVYAQFKRDAAALMEKLSATMPSMPKAPQQDDKAEAYGKVVTEERWMMTEDHWRARWELATNPRYPDLRCLLDTIPDKYRVQFAMEDRAREQAA